MQSTDRRNQMYAHLKWTHSLVLAALALVALAGRAPAQTPEGTVITNTATATYTDANNNAYSAVSGSVSVTVGFKAGVTVTANTPTPSSASPSTADTMTFTVANAGIAQGGSITLKIVYDVASGQGGVTTVYTLTANSRRTPAASGSAFSTITPATTYAAATTPDGGQNVQRLPGSGYSFTFSIGNNGNGNDNFDLIA